MAHFAQLDDDNIVVNVLVVANEDIFDENGDEQEAIGVQFLQDLFGTTDVFVQTSYNNNFRGSYASIGGHYDPQLDAFFPEQPFPSWRKDTTNLCWVAPVDCPEPQDTNGVMSWDEDALDWVEYVYDEALQDHVRVGAA